MMWKTSGYYFLLEVLKTEATLFFEGKEARTTEACTGLLCIYCIELVMKPHVDLTSDLYVNTAPGVSLNLKGELCSRDVPGELKV